MSPLRPFSEPSRAEHCVDTAELLRVGSHLDAAVLHAASQQNAASQHSVTLQQGVAGQELQLVRQGRDALQRERDLLMQQIDMLRSMHHTTQPQPTQAQQRLHEMQHRYDRLLDMPRSAAPPRPSPEREPAVSRTTTPPEDPRGAMRRRIVALLQQHPEGLTPGEIRDLLGVNRPLGDT